jgi:hypothetical protein
MAVYAQATAPPDESGHLLTILSANDSFVVDGNPMPGGGKEVCVTFSFHQARIFRQTGVPPRGAAISETQQYRAIRA